MKVFEATRARAQAARVRAQALDFEKVNGPSERARAAEVKAFGARGYRGDPGTDAAEMRADRAMDATGSWKESARTGMRM